MLHTLSFSKTSTEPTKQKKKNTAKKRVKIHNNNYTKSAGVKNNNNPFS